METENKNKEAPAQLVCSDTVRGGGGGGGGGGGVNERSDTQGEEKEEAPKLPEKRRKTQRRRPDRSGHPEEIRRSQEEKLSLLSEEEVLQRRENYCITGCLATDVQEQLRQEVCTMEAKQEFQNLIEKLWMKLQGLGQASPLEVGAFAVLVLFVATFLFMILLCCIHCCCCGKPKYQASRVQPHESSLCWLNVELQEGTESSDFLLVTVESLNINPELVFPLWWPHGEVDFTTAFPLQGDGGLPCLFHPQRSVEQRSWERLWESLSRERIVWLDMAVLSLEQQGPTASPEDWVDWFLHRMQQEPWALGGFVVLVLFALGVLALAVFALLYGCCCGPQRRKQKDAVI
ncbi:Small integral membrane protein 5 [Oryzias melastigma]|uniref:Small integral membrane protein 5 n=1 Tax=Oryzias melastigma TaxID=30732 RepID=A0A834FM12_ORYME|nr:Small integral membrane protein 5 [Oryzias melastigma]